MKVEGVTRKRNISVQYDMGLGLGRRNPLLEAEALLGVTLANPNTNTITITNTNTKKLKRLPHVFSKVLELPISPDADVSVEELSHCFRFVAEAPEMAHVEACTFEIYPGVTKTVVRETAALSMSMSDFSLDEHDFNLGIWRLRLPESTRPELASAVLVDGQLIVTVPKAPSQDVWSGENRGMSGSATLLLVH